MRTNTVTGPMERPVIFSGDMVKAILEDRKTQTRRILDIKKFGKSETHESIGRFICEKGLWRAQAGTFNSFFPYPGLPCPYGVAGDQIYCRETWRVHRDYDNLSPRLVGVAMGGDTAHCIDYRSTMSVRDFWGKWRPSMHMHRWASRITLEITKVRVERLQDISEEDAKAEGVVPSGRCATHQWSGATGEHISHRRTFRVLWDSLHGASAWDANPWCWVLEFKRHLTGNGTKSATASSVSSPKTSSSGAPSQ